MTFPDKQQRRALDSRSKHTLLLAPAGAGKTELLAQKAVEEARRFKGKEKKFSTKEPLVLVLTHTTNARDSIQKRINIIEANALVRRTILVRTFHSYAL
jgi:superfamily I DNA/RNA helicase